MTRARITAALDEVAEAIRLALLAVDHPDIEARNVGADADAVLVEAVSHLDAGADLVAGLRNKFGGER